MQTSLRLTAAALALILGFGTAEAQSLRGSDGPAETPPASYTGKQYVDSKGCVFVRAGYGGNVTWVPRVSRSRKVLCGMQPTFAKAEPAVSTPRVASAPASAPSRPAAPPPRAAAAPARVAAAPVRTAPVRTAPARTTPAYAAPARTTAVRTAPAPTTPPRAAAAARPAPATPAARTAPATACPNASPVGQRYLKPNSRYPVRCGPQAEAPTGYVTRRAAPDQLGYAPPPVPVGQPPAGFRPAFDDGRLNPDRGPRTVAGNAQMQQVWSNELPRRLVGQDAKRKAGVVVATKNPPPATAPARAPAGHRYVQVGTFGDPGNAQRTAARLQSMGLPVRVGQYRKSGKTYRIVMAGPFGSANQLQAGLSAARRAGFGDAFTRN